MYKAFRYLTLFCYVGLFISLFYSVMLNGPEELPAKIVLWLLMVSGLLLVVIGLIKGSKRSYQWLCFILLIYFIAVVQALFTGAVGEEGTAALHEIVRLLLIVMGFVASMLAASVQIKIEKRAANLPQSSK